MHTPSTILFFFFLIPSHFIYFISSQHNIILLITRIFSLSASYTLSPQLFIYPFVHFIYSFNPHSIWHILITYFDGLSNIMYYTAISSVWCNHFSALFFLMVVLWCDLQMICFFFICSFSFSFSYFFFSNFVTAYMCYMMQICFLLGHVKEIAITSLMRTLKLKKILTYPD